MTTSPRPIAVAALLLTTLLTTSFATAQEPTYPPARTRREAGDPPPVPGSEDMTVQPRGPVHEAFAMPFDMAPRSGPIIAKKPPALIPELPPDQRPEGDNVQWIPGYWAWDVDRQDHLWISGLWRVPPSGRKWVPGAWNAAEGGYQWSPGFWAPTGQDEMPYLPPPPASLDNGPSSPQPNDDSFYVPGNWMYQSSRYLWQPGYWQVYRPGMIWTPSCYSWTPGGYLYVPGYWDWPLANRGLLFAPVAFNRPLWNTPGWSYRPSYCVAYPGLLSSLFLGPTGCGFYFGNYYGPTYRRLGFQPWFTGSYNPLLNWYRWRNLNNPNWLNGLHTTYRGRYNNSLLTVQPLSQYNAGRLARLNPAQINEHRNLARNFQQFSTQRQHVGTRTLPLSRLPHAAAAITPAPGASRIIPAHHSANGPVVTHTPIAPRIQPPAHPLPSVVRTGPHIITPHNPAPVAHHAPAAPVYHAPAAPHYNPPAHHYAPPAHSYTPPAHHFAPPAHHSAPPNHTSGGGHGGGHHR